MTQARGTIDALKEEIKNECSKFSQDIKFWAEFQTGIKVKRLDFKRQFNQRRIVIYIDRLGIRAVACHVRREEGVGASQARDSRRGMLHSRGIEGELGSG